MVRMRRYISDGSVQLLSLAEFLLRPMTLLAFNLGAEARARELIVTISVLSLNLVVLLAPKYTTYSITTSVIFLILRTSVGMVPTHSFRYD